MGYVAVRGGAAAIEDAETFSLVRRAGGVSQLLTPEQIREQLHLAVDRVMGEGSLYAPDLAALAFKQAAGDTFEAAFILRSYCTTLPRLGYSEPIATDGMRVIRRISAAFKDIPGGQILGPTPDYTLRLLDFDLQNESETRTRQQIRRLLQPIERMQPMPESFPKVITMLRAEGLLVRGRTRGAEPEQRHHPSGDSFSGIAQRPAADPGTRGNRRHAGAGLFQHARLRLGAPGDRRAAGGIPAGAVQKPAHRVGGAHR